MATDMNHTHFNPTELDQPPKKTNAQSLSSQLITDDILPIVERKKKKFVVCKDYQQLV